MQPQTKEKVCLNTIFAIVDEHIMFHVIDQAIFNYIINKLLDLYPEAATGKLMGVQVVEPAPSKNAG